MAGTNPIATWLLSKFTTQDPTTYKSAIDGNFAVAQRIVDNFAPRQNNPVALNVVLDAGALYNGAALTEVAQQTTANIAAPVTYPRIDRVVINKATGVVSVITGSESNSPTPPALTTSVYPVAQVLLQTTSTYIANSMITDERADLVGVAQHIAAATVKSTPVGADAFGIWDSVSGMLRQLSMTNLIAYFTGSFLPANYFTPLVWTSGADLSLGIGQSAKITASAATSIPLHIACGDGQIYEIDAVGTYTLVADISVSILQPNNTTPTTNSFIVRQSSAINSGAGSYNAGGVADGGFRLAAVGASIEVCKATFFTSTLNKKSILNSGNSSSVNGCKSGISGTWQDTTTVWSSLGTVILPNAWTGTITVRRVA
jgi:hypothetical protein